MKLIYAASLLILSNYNKAQLLPHFLFHLALKAMPAYFSPDVLFRFILFSGIVRTTVVGFISELAFN